MTKGSSSNLRSQKVCILASSGIDSGLLIKEALTQNYEVFPLYVAAGFIWEETERYFLKQLLKGLESDHLKPLRIMKTDLSHFLPDHHWAYSATGVPSHHASDESVFLPGRNLFLLTHAALYCQSSAIEEIWVGILKGNPFSDAQPAFFENFERTCQAGMEFPVKIRSPFSQWNKDQLITRYPDFPYHLTFSCLNPQGLDHCEACNKCEERKRYLKGNESKKGASHAKI